MVSVARVAESLLITGAAKDAVYRRFGEEGMEIPYPQLDVGFRDGPPGEDDREG